MPIYEYVCSACGQRTEILHGIHDSAPAFCPDCGAEGTLRKGIAAPAVVFKGSGWAKKDRRATSSSSRSGDARDGTSDSKSAEPKSAEPKSGESKPTEPKATESGASRSSESGSGSSSATDKPAARAPEGA